MVLFIKDRDRIARIGEMKKARRRYNEVLNERKPYLAVPFALPAVLAGYIEDIWTLFCPKAKIDEIMMEYVKVTEYVSRT